MSTSARPADIVNAMHRAFRARDLDAIAAYWADDIRYVAPDVDVVGRDARIRDEQAWLGAFTDNDVEVHALVEQGDEVMEFCTLGGVHTGALPLPDGNVLPATNRRIAGAFASHYRIKDGKVVYQQIIYDKFGLLRQLGLV